MTKNKKTEHAGAKNGGGHWGMRDEAKANPLADVRPPDRTPWERLRALFKKKFMGSN